MSDLVSRSALLGAFREYMIERFDRERCSSEESCKSCDRPCLWIRKVSEAPAVDAVPVVHGRWVNERMLRGGFAEVWGLDCSCCGETIEDRDKLPNFCPNCGAKMDGERKEE